MFISGKVYDSGMREMEPKRFMLQLGRSFETLARVHGTFCGVLVRNNKAWLFTDRMNTSKLYYCIYNRSLAVSDRMDTIVNMTGIRPEADMSAWADMLMQYNILGTKCFCKGIHTNRVGEIVEIDLRDFTSRLIGYDPLYGDEKEKRHTVKKAAKNLVCLLGDSLEALCRNTPKEIVLPLSGGLDSRMLAAIAKKRGVAYRSVCFESDLGLDEYKMAKQAADYLGIALDYFELPDDYYERYLDPVLERIEFSSPYHTWIYPFLADAVSSGNCGSQVYVYGVGGDNILRLNPAFKTGRDQTAAQFAEGLEYRVVHYGEFMREDFEEEITKTFRSDLQQEIDRSFHKPRFAIGYEFNTRLARNINLFLYMQSYHLHMFNPFYYTPLVDYVISLHEDTLCGDSLYAEMYNIVDPGLLEFPCTRKYTPGYGLRIKKMNSNVYGKLKEAILDPGFLGRGIIHEDKMEKYFDSLAEKNSVAQLNKLVPIYMLAKWLDQQKNAYGERAGLLQTAGRTGS